MPVIKKMKKCTVCKGILPIESFSKRAGSPDGHQSPCKMCMRLYKQNYKLKKELSAMPPDTKNGTEPVYVRENITPIERRAQLERKLKELDEARMRERELCAEIATIVQQLYADLDTAMQDAEKYRQIQAILRG
jgi:hypothetical protein